MSEAQPQPDQFDPENVAGLDPEIIEAVAAALDERLGAQNGKSSSAGAGG